MQLQHVTFEHHMLLTSTTKSFISFNIWFQSQSIDFTKLVGVDILWKAGFNLISNQPYDTQLLINKN